MPWLNYQDDMYMGKDGACYDITKHPKLVDALGANVMSRYNASKVPYDLNRPGTSRDPGMHSTPLDELFANLL